MQNRSDETIKRAIEISSSMQEKRILKEQAATGCPVLVGIERGDKMGSIVGTNSGAETQALIESSRADLADQGSDYCHMATSIHILTGTSVADPIRYDMEIDCTGVKESSVCAKCDKHFFKSGIQV